MPNLLKLKRGAAASIPQGALAEPLFTTDTYDLYIGKGAGGNQRIQNYIASGTSSQFLKGDGSLDSTSYQPTITLTTTGSSGASTFVSNTLNVPNYTLSGLGGEPAITAGTTSQYWRGDKTWQTLDTNVVPENGPVYFTEPRVLATVLTGLNLTGGGTISASDSVLSAFGKVQNQISALVGGATYQGVWNASTNSPTLASGTGTKGFYYVVNVAGSTNLDGITDWKVGDWAIFNGTTWDKVDNTDAVSSVNGFTGAVNLGLGDISNVTLTSPTNNQLIKFDGTTSKWVNFTPAYEPTLTKGNLTEATSSVLTITGGTGAVIGSGTTIEVKSASATQNGVVTTGTQTFAGIKTFSDAITLGESSGDNQTLLNLPGGSSWIYREGAGSFYGFNITSSVDNSLFWINQEGSQYQAFYYGDGQSTDNIFGISTSTDSGSTWSARFVICQNGNVGINKNNPSYALDVTGAGVFSSTLTASISSLSTASNAFVVSDSGTLKYRTAANVLSDIAALPLAGGTLTGGLIISTTGTQNFTLDTTSTSLNQIYFNMSGTNYGKVYLYKSPGGVYDMVIGTYTANGRVRFETGNNTTALTLNADQSATFVGSISGTSATFSSSVALGTSLNSTTAAMVVENAGIYGSWVELKATSTGGKRWIMQSTGVSAGEGAGKFVINNATDAITALTITSGGNVGIGVSSLVSPGGSRNLLQISNGTNGAQIALGSSTNESNNPRIFSTEYDLGLASHKASGKIEFYTDDTVRLTIAQAGAASFSSSVTIQGGSSLLVNNAANTRSGSLATTADGTVLSSHNGSGEPLLLKSPDTNGYIGLFTGSSTSERMRITSGGQIYNSNPPANDWAMKINGSSTSGQSFGIKISAGSTSADSSFQVSDKAGTTDYLAIRGDGIATFYSSIKTGAPSGGTAKPWKFGNRIATTSQTLNSSQYIELDVDGTLYKLATCN